MRWRSIDKHFKTDKEIIFISETHCNVNSLENLNDFTVYGDPSFPALQKHGGLAVYVKNNLPEYTKNLRFSKFTISFTISIMPNIFFMGVYTLLIQKGCQPSLGGDFNSRLRDINELSTKS